MGKRKERRLAAMSAAGRRVKLDLFAEPSGDSGGGGSSAQDELGGDLNPRHHAGSPNSPSSSGKQPENPLLLLGQYSDDELDEESSKKLDLASVRKSSVDDEQVESPVVEVNENNATTNLDSCKDKQQDLEIGSVSLDALKNLEDNNHREEYTETGVKEEISMEDTHVPGTSDAQVTDDVNSRWEVVLHEESNQYYYWNTLTGETSWVVPDVPAQGIELTAKQFSAPETEERSNAVDGAYQPHSTLELQLEGDHSIAANVIFQGQEINEHESQMGVQNDEYRDGVLEDKTQGADTRQSEEIKSYGATKELYSKTFSGDTPFGSKSPGDVDSEKFISNQIVDEGDMENDLCYSALKHGEFLLERLGSMEGSQNHMKGHDWMSKYILEVEIRLSDIKSLLPFGSSLLPLWVHCERRFKELEGAIEAEASQFLKAAQICEADATHESQESVRSRIEVDRNETKVVCSAFENSNTSGDAGTSTVFHDDSRHEDASSDVFHVEHGPAIVYPTAHSSSIVGGKSGVDETAQPAELKSGVDEAAQPAELSPETVIHAGEDVDMDVDMEVEETTPASVAVSGDLFAAKCCASAEQSLQPNPPAGYESFLKQEVFGVPPPPDEDWIPPPPPDDELIPPPPPDDPPEPAYPPPTIYSETGQPLTYTEQYTMSYPNSNFEFYGQTNPEFPANNVYRHAEGGQVVMPHPPLYFEALPSTYHAAAPVVGNPVEAIPYYDLQDGAVLPGPEECSAQSSGLHGSDQIGSVGSDTVGDGALLSITEIGIPAVSGGTEKASIEGSVNPAAVQTPVTTSVVESAPVSSTTAVTAVAVAVAANSTAPNGQPKVQRSKKRTIAIVSTLSSNKKVSSLVHKWKAAKEELHDDDDDEEDEPENAYDILEKKRRRDIEEWRAQQIASGEAKDNANFQPLGGDWRERVKRKRAQLNREALQTPSEAPVGGTQQPDLNGLSRDLPSGWQAFWDESSKQVYYGNAITSETTWTRPAK